MDFFFGKIPWRQFEALMNACIWIQFANALHSMPIAIIKIDVYFFRNIIFSTICIIWISDGPWNGSLFTFLQANFDDSRASVDGYWPNFYIFPMWMGNIKLKSSRFWIYWSNRIESFAGNKLSIIQYYSNSGSVRFVCNHQFQYMYWIHTMKLHISHHITLALCFKHNQ